MPVLLNEVLDGLAISSGARLIDCTLGGGGHTQHMLAASVPNGIVLGVDADPAAIRRVEQRLQTAVNNRRLLLHQGNFGDLASIAQANNFVDVDGILLDLGISSFQLETAMRGFSFMHDGPLDMRFDPAQEISAADIVNHWDEVELADILYRYGDERQSRRIARVLVQHRQQQAITTTEMLAQLVAKAVGKKSLGKKALGKKVQGKKNQSKRIHPATKTFQALRIAVNQELVQLERVLHTSLDLLKPGGRIAVISFHSLEDRIVKQWMQQEAREYVQDPSHLYGGYERTPTLKLVTRKPIVPSTAEVSENPRSRSAKLRIAMKVISEELIVES
ncbi:MAG: 16S rRNA (cytosine(1402)-N(4))-methyltransferase RsmH [Chloroflexota bacterium]